jgi:hypothetical protein
VIKRIRIVGLFFFFFLIRSCWPLLLLIMHSFFHLRSYCAIINMLLLYIADANIFSWVIQYNQIGMIMKYFYFLNNFCCFWSSRIFFFLIVDDRICTKNMTTSTLKTRTLWWNWFFFCLSVCLSYSCSRVYT